MRRSFPEVKWVFFCCCFVHFCPFGQSKLRQFAIVWLHSQSSCMWHWVHNTPPQKKTTPPPLLCGTMRTSRLQFSRYFWHSVKTCWTRDKYSTDGSGLDLDWMTTCFSQLVLGRVTLKKKKKIQDSSVYRHSGPFIRKLAVLIQLRESSWTIQEKKQC